MGKRDPPGLHSRPCSGAVFRIMRLLKRSSTLQGLQIRGQRRSWFSLCLGRRTKPPSGARPQLGCHKGQGHGGDSSGNGLDA